MLSFKKSFLQNFKSKIINWLCIVLLVCAVSSCQSSLSYSPVKYDKAAINTLLADTTFGYLLLQFSTQNGESSKNAFTLISYSYKNNNDVLNSSPYSLGVPGGATSLSFSDSLIMGNQRASRKDLVDALTDPATMAKVDYDYILFTPAFDSASHYVYYTISAGKNEKDSAFVLPPPSRTQPCPPAICSSLSQ